jgi:hypothetical protein
VKLKTNNFFYERAKKKNRNKKNKDQIENNNI